jgi:hypothetical protein
MREDFSKKFLRSDFGLVAMFFLTLKDLNMSDLKISAGGNQVANVGGANLLALAGSPAAANPEYRKNVKDHLGKVLVHQTQWSHGDSHRMSSIDQMTSYVISKYYNPKEYARLSTELNKAVSSSTSGKIKDWRELLGPKGRSDLADALKSANGPVTIHTAFRGNFVNVQDAVHSGGADRVKSGDTDLRRLGAEFLGAKKLAWGNNGDLDNVAVYRITNKLATAIVNKGLSVADAPAGWGNQLPQNEVGWALIPDKKDKNMMILALVSGTNRTAVHSYLNNPGNWRSDDVGLRAVTSRVPHLKQQSW